MSSRWVGRDGQPLRALDGMKGLLGPTSICWVALGRDLRDAEMCRRFQHTFAELTAGQRKA